MEITKERIFAALIAAGAVKESVVPGRFYWAGGELADKLKFSHADPVKYAQYLANDINIILAERPEERQ